MDKFWHRKKVSLNFISCVCPHSKYLVAGTHARGLRSLRARLLEEDLRGEALDGDLARLVVDDEDAVLLVRVLDVPAENVTR